MENTLHYSDLNYDNLIDAKLLQKFQEHFCRANSIYVCCLDKNGDRVTECHGSIEERNYLKKAVAKEEWEALVRRSLGNRVESIVEEDFPQRNLKVCTVVSRFNEEIQVVWVAAGFVESCEFCDLEEEAPRYMMRTTEERFYRSIEFLEEMSRYIFITRVDEMIAQEAIQQHHEVVAEIREQLFRSEATTKIVTMLESDAAIGQIIDDILREVCETLNIPRGFMLRRDTKNGSDYISMICEYAKNPNHAQITNLQMVPIDEFPVFNGKTYVISAESAIPTGFRDMMGRLQAVTAVFQPIVSNEKAIMYLGFVDTNMDQVWETENLKFINDVRRILQTILVKRISKNSLASSYASLEAILEHVGCGICVYDREKRKLLYRNQLFKDIYGRSIASGQLERVLFLVDDNENSYREIYMQEEDCWIDQHSTTITWVDGSQVDLCSAYDITEKKRYQAKIEQQANYDLLTGLYNRMRCEQDLEKHIRLVLADGTHGALIYIDLDDFKHINDGLGHQHGDVLLKSISHSLQKIKGIGSNCYRVGGDEFMVILSGQAYHDIDRICEEIRDIFNRPWFLKGEDYYCTTSMGVVTFPENGNEVEDLIRKVDLALFRAKRAGKNCVEFYSEIDDQASSRRLDVEKNMRRAAQDASTEFEVYFQPIVDIRGDRESCCGAEALVRWNSPELGFISPADFIPMAEYLGLINPIGDYVLLEAAKHCRYWNDMGHPEFKVNVNLSVVQLLQSDVVKKLEKVLADTHVNPRNLTLEVTESLAINDMERMKTILNQIKALGVRVALDDFGTGYSSLNHIREIPLDVIKIDKCFVDDLAKDNFSDAFVQMVAALASALGVSVCVEGVETEQQYQRLKSMSIDMIQGYYFGKPMRVEEFEQKYVL